MQELLFEYLGSVFAQPYTAREALRAALTPAAVKADGAYVFYDRRTLAEFAFAVPNGSMLAGTPGQRAKYMASLKKRGLKPGVSDVMIAWPMGKYHGAFLELKKDKTSKRSTDQKLWIAKMEHAGYYAKFVNGIDEAITAVKEYMSLKQVVPK